jgi:hypothetical protein
MSRIVYLLSYQITMSLCKWNRMFANKRIVAIAFLLTFVKAKSLASVEDLRSIESFAKEASVNISISES